MVEPHPFLLFRDDDGHEVVVDLDAARERVSIGRRRSNEVRLGWDAGVSRLHAELTLLGGDWVVCDEGLSRNGTFVNGERVHGRRRLHGGDVIAVGDTLIAFCDASSPSTAPRTRPASREDAAVAITPAQGRVLAALCRPLRSGRYAAPASNRQIADELVLSILTVKCTLARLFELFAVDHLPQNQKRASLALRALERGLVPADQR